MGNFNRMRMFLWLCVFGVAHGVDSGATIQDKTWEFNRSDGAKISFYATIPPVADFKDLDAAYDACLARGMSLATVSTEEEQTEIYQKINDHLSKDELKPPVAYWIGLKRGQGPKGDQTKEFSWMYPYNGNQRRCPLTQKHPTFWITEKPDHNSDLNCVNMLFNFVDTFPELGPLKNWNGEKCSNNYSGVQGAAHGYICSNQTEMAQCTEQFSGSEIFKQVSLCILLMFLI